MRAEIEAPSDYHKSKLKKTAPFILPNNFVYAAQMPRKHMQVGSDGSVQPTTPLIAHLHASHLPHDQISRAVTLQSEVIPATEQEFDISKYAPEGIVGYVLGTAEHHFNLINNSMAGPKRKEIINRHDGEHALNVSNTALTLVRDVLSPSPSPQDIAKLQAGAFAFALHDVGNLIGRSDHSCHSVRLARLLYPNVEMTDEQAKLFDTTILLHDGDDIDELFKEWGKISSKEAINKLSEFGAVPLGLIVADKADIGLSRLPKGKRVPKLDYQDIHRVLNVHWESERLGFVNSTEMELLLAFDKSITPEQASEIPTFVRVKPEGVERRKSAILKKTDKTDYQKLLEEYWANYYPRTMLAVMAGFAMNPILENVNITMYNARTNTPDNPNDVFTFNKASLAKDMYQVFNRYVPDTKKELPNFKQYADFAVRERVV